MISIRNVEKFLKDTGYCIDKFPNASIPSKSSEEVLSIVRELSHNGIILPGNMPEFVRSLGCFSSLFFQEFNLRRDKHIEILEEDYEKANIDEALIQDIKQLVDLIAAGSRDYKNPGPVVIEREIWDGRKVKASYCSDKRTLYDGKEKPDIASTETMIWDDTSLFPLVEALVNETKPIIAEYGCLDDYVGVLKWTITEK